MEEQWFDEELSGCRLGDGRLDRRLRQLVEHMDSKLGETIPLACQDCAHTPRSIIAATERPRPQHVPSPNEVLTEEAARTAFGVLSKPLLRYLRVGRFTHCAATRARLSVRLCDHRRARDDHPSAAILRVEQVRESEPAQPV